MALLPVLVIKFGTSFIPYIRLAATGTIAGWKWLFFDHSSPFFVTEQGYAP
jgi:hypothetical protein